MGKLRHVLTKSKSHGSWGALEFEREMTPGSHHTLVTGPSCLLPCPLVTAWEFNTSFCRKPRQTTVSFIQSAKPQGWAMLGLAGHTALQCLSSRVGGPAPGHIPGMWVSYRPSTGMWPNLPHHSAPRVHRWRADFNGIHSSNGLSVKETRRPLVLGSNTQ